MPTDKKMLMKGVRYMATALPFMFIGPVVIHSAFKNQGHPFFIPVLGLAVITCIFSVFMAFKGINTIIKSLFDS
ncbi:hypothetical protein CHU92_04105 [Flavobacterium cyanobacteriorum]|uniref:Uncharacterized protein n=1 Tax=Flavobacterium cyanobacteriorum TaxID=2022802 RepID=A0A255ZKT8_9FLAO|nr:DUF6095 family protein [Flavobacterium cyanobacteriorum]OYQ42022.1 hypothetical protein CHU92_04105 [Flavobacterium cyanobacteriorum]